MAQENGLRFKLVYSHWIEKNGFSFPAPNGLHIETVNWLKRFTDEYPYIIYSQFRAAEVDEFFHKPEPGYFFRHSNFLGYFNHFASLDYIVREESINEADEYTYLYPIEVEWGGIGIIHDVRKFIIDGKEYTWKFDEVLTPTILRYLKSGKVKLVVTNIVDPHTPWHDEEIIKMVVAMGIDPHNVMFVQGNVPSKFINNTDPSAPIMLGGDLSLTQGAANIRKYPFTSALGYWSEIVRESDLDPNKLRTKRFTCFNRSMNRPHRIAMAHVAMKYNLLDNNIFSFVTNIDNNVSEQLRRLYPSMSPQALENAAQKVRDLVPYELDTQHLTEHEKQCFSAIENNKKEFYDDTYIHLTSETSFNEDASPFFSEKTWRPIFNLQPFIYIGNYRALEKLKNLGFKTFHPFIDESYDLEKDSVKRWAMIEAEILKFNNMPIEEIHKWYYSITDILLHNQAHMYTFLEHNPLDEVFSYFKQS